MIGDSGNAYVVALVILAMVLVAVAGYHWLPKADVQLALPCMLMVRAAKHLTPHEMALIGLLEVLLGPIWAWLGAGEAIPAATAQGGVVVLAALAANAWWGYARAPSPRPA